MYRVLWLQSVLNELTAHWLVADSATRQAITAAANTIEQELRDDPEEKGESREEDERVLFAPPLGVTFEVDLHQHIVTILHVWVFRSRRQ